MALEALKWITNLLTEKRIPFVVCGGLAAIGYGSTRPLNDIDLFVPGEKFQEVVRAAEKYISKPPKHYTEEGWDLEYVQFIYHGTKVEVGNDDGVKVYSSKLKKSFPLQISFTDINYVEVLGIIIPLMQANDLITYKRVLNRPVDQEDIKAIQANL